MSLSADQIRLLDHWQTLAAGVLAIAAALVGSLFVSGQIVQAHLQRRDQIDRQLRAARALSPLALSAVADYAGVAARQLNAVRSTNALLEQPNTTPPDLPMVVVPQLEKLIEASDRRQGDAIAAVVRKLQVQSVRSREFLSEVASGQLMPAAIQIRSDEHILDAAEVYALTARLFRFARGETGKVARGTLTLMEISTALIACGVYDFSFAGAIPSLRNRYINPPPRLFDRIQSAIKSRFGQDIEVIELE